MKEKKDIRSGQGTKDGNSKSGKIVTEKPDSKKKTATGKPSK